MTSYSKSAQTYSKKITRKKCNTCNKTRDIKFFSSKQARKCTDCKKRKWRDDLKNSPGKVNKKKDKKWADDIKERDGFKCVKCKKDTYLNAHHIFSRSNYSTRWDLDNGITLCSGCHVFSSKFSAHKTPVEFIEWLKDLRGNEWYEELRLKARQIYKR